MATCWAKCSDLFLYTKGNKDVYLWRCNETTTWMPMKTADFDDLGKVMDHQDLIGGGKDAVFEWERSAYIDLVAYISSRRLLVNSRGLVIAELHQFDQDGKMEEENGLPFYIRSLDVLSLKHFGLRDRTIPLRTVLYLETEGKVAHVEDSATTTTTTELDEGKWRAEMEKQVAELKAAIKTKAADLQTQIDSDKQAAEKEATELKETNKTLKSGKEAAEKEATELKETNKTLKSGKEAAEKKITELKETNKTLKSGKEAAEKKITELKEENKTLRSGKEASDKQVKDLQDHIKTKSLMSDPYIPRDNNMGFVSLSALGMSYHVLTLVGSPGSFTTEDDTTNVRASYMYKLTSTVNGAVLTWRGVDIDSLPKKEMARFKLGIWYKANYIGRPYATKLAS